MKLTLTLKTDNVSIEEIPKILNRVKSAIIKGYAMDIGKAGNKKYSFTLTEEKK